MPHDLVFYRDADGAEVVLDVLRSLGEAERCGLGEDLRTLEFGFAHGLPLCDRLGRGLWEARCRLGSEDEARLIFFHQGPGRTLVAVHASVGGTRRTPRTGVDAALRRKAEFTPGRRASAAAGPRSVAGLTTLQDLLEADGIREAATARAVKRVVARQLHQAMKARRLTKKAMAELMRTSRAQVDRMLDPGSFNVTLDTLARAARIAGREIRVELV